MMKKFIVLLFAIAVIASAIVSPALANNGQDNNGYPGRYDNCTGNFLGAYYVSSTDRSWHANYYCQV